MKILVLSFYFRPDLSAGSFRTTALVDALRRKAPPGSGIEVMTTLPNRYSTFVADAPALERAEGLTIHRIALPRHRSGMVDQSRAFMTFARRVSALTHDQAYDVVYATSSRLMTAVLGAWIARRRAARLYLDIRDIFADTIKDVFSGPAGTIAERAFGLLERFAVGSATRVNVVSGGFVEYFASRYPGVPLSCFSNGIDEEFLAAAPAAVAPSLRPGGDQTVTLLYAGNVGEGQGLSGIVPGFAAACPHVRIRIIGDGGRLEALRREVKLAKVTNVEISPPVGRAQLVQAYRDADVLFLHLNDYPAFRKVLPSKIFEYAAMGKPILAGVGGFAADFLAKEVTNAAVFPPCDVPAAVAALGRLKLQDEPRAGFNARFSRAAITDRLAEDVLASAG